mmetsp:Transcript_118516/g.335236  ORF Transcript_118516/g.335236 Transcript_118516/m.335236 type:complete len:304 (+) Transcript_118516:3383-4294(+)
MARAWLNSEDSVAEEVDVPTGTKSVQLTSVDVAGGGAMGSGGALGSRKRDASEGISAPGSACISANKFGLITEEPPQALLELVAMALLLLLPATSDCCGFGFSPDLSSPGDGAGRANNASLAVFAAADKAAARSSSALLVVGTLVDKARSIAAVLPLESAAPVLLLASPDSLRPPRREASARGLSRDLSFSAGRRSRSLLRRDGSRPPLCRGGSLSRLWRDLSVTVRAESSRGSLLCRFSRAEGPSLRRALFVILSWDRLLPARVTSPSESTSTTSPRLRGITVHEGHVANGANTRGATLSHA